MVPTILAIRDSIAVVDALLKADTPNGPVWHRYNGDGYGEHDDGVAFDGSGRGRAWPLLTGERGHYELVAGRDPRLYLKTMAAMTGPGRPDARAGVGHHGHTVETPLSGVSDGFGHATRMGARGIHQADGFIPPGISVRPPYCALEALRRTSPRTERYLVPACADRPNCTGSKPHHRHTTPGANSLGARMAGRMLRTRAPVTRASDCMSWTFTPHR